jgi:hypothetical protein
MRVSIILSGQPRFNDETISLFNQNIVNELSKNHEVEIFVSTKPEFVERWKQMHSSVPVNIYISEYTEFKDSNFSLSKTCENKKHYNQLHNLLSAINYAKIFNPDIVFKARSDFVYTNKVSELLLDDYLHVADWEVQNLRRSTLSPGFITDQIYYGKHSLILKIIQGVMFDKTFGYDVNHGIEKQLYLFTNYYNIRVAFFDFEFFHARELYHEFEYDLELLPVFPVQ